MDAKTPLQPSAPALVLDFDIHARCFSQRRKQMHPHRFERQQGWRMANCPQSKVSRFQL